MQRSLHIDLPLIGHLCHWGQALHRYSVCARLLVVHRLSLSRILSLPGLRLGAAILTCVFGPPTRRRSRPTTASDSPLLHRARPDVTSSQRRGTASACIGLLPVRLPPMPRACRVRSLGRHSADPADQWAAGGTVSRSVRKIELFVRGGRTGARASARTRGVDSVLACAAGGLNTNRAVRVTCSGRAAPSSSAVCATRPSSATCAAPSSSATCAARSTAGTAAASPSSLRQRTGTQGDCRH
jgi:hypothetical protein